MSKSYAAVLIAVGTELSQGQVINSNTSWLANLLNQAGLGEMLHLTLPDDRGLIKSALEYAATVSDLLIVCGGLGPTSDDFSREVIADWLAQDLVLNQDSWQRLQARAQKYGFSLGHSQQQQCFFPIEAEVIVNPVGTADAFFVRKDDLHVFALPGPPREIRELWSAGLLTHLSRFFPDRPATRLHLWQCLGIGEGNLAEQVDALIANQSISCQVGYRAHFPYIEVKLWLPQAVDTSNLLNTVEALLGPWVVLRQEEDAALRLMHALPPDHKIKIFDFGSQSELAHRLGAVMPHLSGEYQQLELTTVWQPQVAELPEMMAQLASLRASQTIESRSESVDFSECHELILVLGALEVDHHWGLGLIYQNELKFERISMPRRYNQQQIQIYQAEMALIHWWKWLHEKTA